MKEKYGLLIWKSKSPISIAIIIIILAIVVPFIILIFGDLYYSSFRISIIGILLIIFLLSFITLIISYYSLNYMKIYENGVMLRNDKPLFHLTSKFIPFNIIEDIQIKYHDFSIKLTLFIRNQDPIKRDVTKIENIDDGVKIILNIIKSS